MFLMEEWIDVCSLTITADLEFLDGTTYYMHSNTSTSLFLSAWIVHRMDGEWEHGMVWRSILNVKIIIMMIYKCQSLPLCWT